MIRSGHHLTMIFEAFENRMLPGRPGKRMGAKLSSLQDHDVPKPKLLRIE